MPKVIYREFCGKIHEIDGNVGESVMHVARNNNVPGIEADCGGACACGTCQIYVDNAWQEATGKSSPMEETMLSFTENVKDSSRLSCQIILSNALNGLIVSIPESQY